MAEQAGFEGLWVFDHFKPLYADPKGPCFEGWTLLAALAGVTDTGAVQLSALSQFAAFSTPPDMCSIQPSVLRSSRVQLWRGRRCATAASWRSSFRRVRVSACHALMPALFTCGRTAGWCAHILEQKNTGRLVRPSARYIGPDPRKPEEVDGFDTITTKTTTQVAPA